MNTLPKRKSNAVKVWVYPGHLKESFFNVYNHSFSRSVRAPYMLVPLKEYRELKHEVKESEAAWMEKDAELKAMRGRCVDRKTWASLRRRYDRLIDLTARYIGEKAKPTPKPHGGKE